MKYFDINKSGHSIKCKIFGKDLRSLEHVVVFMHGYGGHKDTRAAEHFAEAYLSKQKKAAVLVFDWPCHGTDVKKKLSLEDCNTYLEMVLDYVKTEFKVSDICAYGTSFGGYLTLKYLHDHGKNPFRKIALRCPAVCMYDVMYKRVMTEENKALLEKGKEAMTGFDRKVQIDKAFLDSLKENDIRKWEYFDYADDIIIIHGTKDELIPISEVESFTDNNVISFYPVENADHRFQNLDLMKLAHSIIIDFMTKGT